MARVALLTMSNGRDFVARELTGFCREAEDAVTVATSSARRLAASQPHLTIFHYPVRALPHFRSERRPGQTGTEGNHPG
jgi:L-fucose isomerase